MRIVKSTFVVLAIVVASDIRLAASGVDPDKDPQMEKLLWDARHLVDAKNASAALPKCDAVISAYKAYYGSRKEKIYCGRSGTETLGALLKAAADKENAIALSSTWADAYYMKAYALQDTHRLTEAKSTLQLALKLSPFQQSLLVAVPVVVGSLGRIPVGALTDRLGGRVMFPIISLTTVVPVLYLGLFGHSSLVALLVGGFFLGIAGTAFAVGVPFVSAWFPPERRGFAVGVSASVGGRSRGRGG